MMVSSRRAAATRLATPFFCLSALGFSALGVLPCAAAAQVSPVVREAAVDTLLVAAHVPDFLAGIAPAVEQQLAALAPSLTEEQTRRAHEALLRHLAPAVLYREIALSVFDQSEAARLQEVASWLSSGPVAEVRRREATERPPQTFEQFGAAVLTTPPAETRVRIALRTARAQSSGGFFLLVSESIRGAAHAAARSLGVELPPFRGLPTDQADEVVQTRDREAAFRILYQDQGIPESLLDEVAGRYESAAGQWYGDAVARAVSGAILSAADRVAAELRGASDDFLDLLQTAPYP